MEMVSMKSSCLDLNPPGVANSSSFIASANGSLFFFSTDTLKVLLRIQVIKMFVQEEPIMRKLRKLSMIQRLFHLRRSSNTYLESSIQHPLTNKRMMLGRNIVWVFTQIMMKRLSWLKPISKRDKRIIQSQLY